MKSTESPNAGNSVLQVAQPLGGSPVRRGYPVLLAYAERFKPFAANRTIVDVPFAVSVGISNGPMEPDLPRVEVPGRNMNLLKFAERVGGEMSATGEHFLFGDALVRLIVESGSARPKPVSHVGLCSEIELVCVPGTSGSDKDDNPTFERCIISESLARKVTEARTFKDNLPVIRVFASCPVLVRRDSELVQVVGYDRKTGIYASGCPAPDVELSEAIRLLTEIFIDFHFVSDGDRRRALAAIFTVAFIQGGLFGSARAPMTVVEADRSQAGKGFLVQLIAAIFNTEEKIVKQNGKWGVGSIKEEFDSVLASGASFIKLDNLRDALDCPAIESFLTESTYKARPPYSVYFDIDPRRVAILATSNKLEFTEDLANRSNCVRLLKRTDNKYNFKKFGSNNVLDHVKQNASLYQGAVFAIIREWYRRGEKQLEQVDHDFHVWASIIGSIIEDVMGLGKMLEGHREIQQRISSTDESWFRELMIAVQNRWQNREQPLLTANLLNIAMAERVPLPGIDLNSVAIDDEKFVKSLRKLGVMLSRVFGGEESYIMDAMEVKRMTGKDREGRTRQEYFLEVAPEVTRKVSGTCNAVFLENPEAPEPLENFVTAVKTAVKYRLL